MTSKKNIANLEHENGTVLGKCILSNVKGCIVQKRIHEYSGDVK